MTFRWIEGKALEQLSPIMESHGWTPLDPVFSKVLIAEDDRGNIVGFNALQVVLRPEPLWIAKNHRGAKEDLAMQLSTKMIDYLREKKAAYWEIRAQSPYVERLCIANNMQEIGVPMFAGGIK